MFLNKILKKQTNGVGYYKVVKETEHYLWVRLLEKEVLRHEDCYQYYVPIEDKFFGNEILKIKKRIYKGELSLRINDWPVHEYDETDPGYHWWGA